MASEDGVLPSEKGYSIQANNEMNVTHNVFKHERKDHEEQFETNLKYIFVSVYCIIFVIGLFPNVLLTYLLFTRKFMRVKYIFTASISIAHILFCVTCLPLILSSLVYNDGTSGKDAARACQVFVCLVFSVTSLSMLSTAIRRSLAISERFRYANFTYRQKVKNVVGLWIFSVIISLPYICILKIAKSPFDLSEFNNQQLRYAYTFASDGNISASTPVIQYLNLNRSVCSNCTVYKNQDFATNYSTEYCFMNMSIYTTIISLLTLAISVTLALIFQTITLYGLKKRPNQIHWLKEIMITKQHIIMLAIFMTCWAPLTVVVLVTNDSLLTIWQKGMLKVLAASFVMYNPVLYFFLNAHVKRELQVWIGNVIAYLWPVQEQR